MAETVVTNLHACGCSLPDCQSCHPPHSAACQHHGEIRVAGPTVWLVCYECGYEGAKMRYDGRGWVAP